MYYIGIDVGGSNLKCGMCNEDGKLVHIEKCKVLDVITHNDLLQTFVNLIDNCCSSVQITRSDIASIGIAVPGAVDIHSGIILYACNLPVKNVPIRKYLKSFFHCPILLENDANCAALSEYYFGSGVGTKRFIMVTLGTGVGGGIIHNGKIFHGGNGFAGEVGHMTIVHNGIQCPCGNNGCWEQYSSAPALKRMTKIAIENHPNSILKKVVDENNGHISGQSAFIASRRGDPCAQQVCHDYLSFLSTGMLNLINIFQPDVIAIGGGISNESDDQLLIPLNNMIRTRMMPVRLTSNTEVVKAVLGNDAGMIGAALLGRKKRF